MSGMASNELRQAADSLGARAFLEKPFPMARLKATLDALLPPGSSSAR